EDGGAWHLGLWGRAASGSCPSRERTVPRGAVSGYSRAMLSRRALAGSQAVPLVALLSLGAACSHEREREQAPNVGPFPPAVAESATKPEPDVDAEFADLATTLRANYTKFEHRVRMRDGTALFTQVYAPKDHTRTYPILLMRTPYGVAPYGV